MGLAAAWALSRRGHDVHVLERFEHVHERGSHGGYTRIIRQAYHEGSDYVRLVRAADEAWTALERRAGQRLLVRCGLLEFGAPDDSQFEAARQSLRAHTIEHLELDAAEAMRRWPIEIPDDWLACLTPESGYLRVPACLDALRDEASAAGARFEYGVRVNEIVCGGSTPRVLLEEGTLLAADQVIVAVGSYAGQMLPSFFREDGHDLFRAQRRVLAWTRPGAAHDRALRELPVWGAFVPEGFFYGFPLADEGVSGFKLACHEARAIPWLDDAVDPEQVRREVDERDYALLRDFLARYLPAAAGEFVEAKVCMYGSTPGWDFLVDAHPEDGRVWVASGFSGHGFKFAPEVGEMLADLVEDGRSERRLEIFHRKSHIL
jgi:monomeric sarcosine oxidase